LFRLLKKLSIWDVLFAGLAIFLLVRLGPHLGAIVGYAPDSGQGPEYHYQALDGSVVSSEGFRGKVVLVNFWATWCTPCKVEMPLLESMYKRHRADGFVLVGLAMDRAPTSVVEEFVRERGVTYPNAHVGSEAEARFGGIRGYPTSILIGRDGRVRHKVMGPIGAVTLELAVRRLLAEE